MAWRIHEHVVHGEIDNRTRGRVTGRIWLAGSAAPLVLQLEGNCQPDLAGCFLKFENPQPVAMKTAPPASFQRGTADEITAARRVRVLDVPVEEAMAMSRSGEKPPEHLANSFYLAWHSNVSGRFVIESSDYRLEVSDPAWRFTPEELAENARLAEEAGAQPFAIAIDDGGNTEVWDEFRCEQLLRESDSRTEKFGELLEKYRDHPDRDRIIAREMDWPWMEETLEADAAAYEDRNGVPAASGAEDNFEIALDPVREGIDWVRNEHGDPVHPIAKRVHDALYDLLDERKAAGLFPESGDEQLENFVAQFMTLSAKLAGAFSSIVRDGARADVALSIAFLKRALNVLNETIRAADAEALIKSLPPDRVAHYRSELFAVREAILALLARLRETPL